MNVAYSTLNEVDIVMWIVEPTTFIGAGERHIIDVLSKVNTPVVLVINKTDTVDKQAVADALRKLLEQKPFAKISVSHICEECGMNRKSFYYHFKDKYDLVNWIFDTEITKIFSEEEWKNAGFTWDILEKICEYFYKHRTFYSKVLQIEGQNSFTEHFRDILVPVNRKFLAMVEEEEKGEHEEFYIHFFSDAFLAALVRWLEDRECVSPQEFSALLRSSVEMIAKYVLQSQK